MDISLLKFMIDNLVVKWEDDPGKKHCDNCSRDEVPNKNEKEIHDQ